MTSNLFQGTSVQNANQQPFMDQNSMYRNGNMINNTGFNNSYMNRPAVMTQPINPSVIPGRVVFSPDQISPQEIPTNGSAALFPLSDGSKIIVKAMLPNGTFGTECYTLAQPEKEDDQKAEPSEFDKLMYRLDTLENTINNALSNVSTQNNKANNNKRPSEKAVNQNE